MLHLLHAFRGIRNIRLLLNNSCSLLCVKFAQFLKTTSNNMFWGREWCLWTYNQPGRCCKRSTIRPDPRPRVVHYQHSVGTAVLVAGIFVQVSARKRISCSVSGNLWSVGCPLEDQLFWWRESLIRWMAARGSAILIAGIFDQMGAR